MQYSVSIADTMEIKQIEHIKKLIHIIYYHKSLLILYPVRNVLDSGLE